MSMVHQRTSSDSHSEGDIAEWQTPPSSPNVPFQSPNEERTPPFTWSRSDAEARRLLKGKGKVVADNPPLLSLASKHLEPELNILPATNGYALQAYPPDSSEAKETKTVEEVNLFSLP